MHPNVHTPISPVRRAAAGGSRMNALKHGLRSTAVLLPGDDVDAFEHMRQELYGLYRPRTGNEARCVEAMASHEWGMERCRRWRHLYHGKLDALLTGDSAAGPHCEGDPHRWHHSAMDCALEEGRLGRLQDRELRKLAELQHLRRRNLLRDAVEIDERELGAPPEPLGASADPPPPVRPARGEECAAVPPEDARAATVSSDEESGENPKRTAWNVTASRAAPLERPVPPHPPAPELGPAQGLEPTRAGVGHGVMSTGTRGA